MPNPWVTDAELLQAVADFMGTTVARITTAPNERFGRIVPIANTSAYNDIRDALLARGYTAAQLDNWEQRVQYSLDIGTYHAFVRGGGLSSFPDVQAKVLDRRPQLKTLTLYNSAGELILPEGLSGGGADGTDLDGDGRADRFGGGPAVGGRINQNGFRFNLDTHW